MFGISESDAEALALNRFGGVSAILKTAHPAVRLHSPGKCGAGSVRTRCRRFHAATLQRSDALFAQSQSGAVGTRFLSTMRWRSSVFASIFAISIDDSVKSITSKLARIFSSLVDIVLIETPF